MFAFNNRRSFWKAVVCLWTATAFPLFADPLPAPPLVSPIDEAFFTFVQINQGQELDWSDLPGATQYQVNIIGPAAFGTRTNTIENSNLIFPRTTAEGLYYWRVRAIDSEGVPGTYSTPRILVIANEGIANPAYKFDFDFSGRIDILDLHILYKYIRNDDFRGDLTRNHQTNQEDLWLFSKWWEVIY